VTPREEQERREDLFLASWASRARCSRGRERPEEPCPIRTAYQRDRDRIVHCKAFRRLKHKTQVLLLPEGDHYRTRLTHTLEVSQIARTIARALALNEDLTEAIALGHDLGHTPFGHMGERVLDRLAREGGRAEGFHHARQSLRVVERLEREGSGLNLTWEVRMGILQHSKGQVDVREGFRLEAPSTPEAWVVRVSDSIAYLNHDLDDAIRAGLITPEDLPDLVRERLGRTHGQRIGALVGDVLAHSGEGKIAFGPERLEAIEALRSFLHERVYSGPAARREAPKVEHLLRFLFERGLSDRMRDGGDRRAALDATIDYLAGMTDRYALALFAELGVPSPWPAAHARAEGRSGPSPRREMPLGTPETGPFHE
jgi:dGTPase